MPDINIDAEATSTHTGIELKMEAQLLYGPDDWQEIDPGFIIVDVDKEDDGDA